MEEDGLNLWFWVWVDWVEAGERNLEDEDGERRGCAQPAR